jgi:hypothetical protein
VSSRGRLSSLGNSLRAAHSRSRSRDRRASRARRRVSRRRSLRRLTNSGAVTSPTAAAVRSREADHSGQPASCASASTRWPAARSRPSVSRSSPRHSVSRRSGCSSR